VKNLHSVTPNAAKAMTRENGGGHIETGRNLMPSGYDKSERTLRKKPEKGEVKERRLKRAREKM